MTEMQYINQSRLSSSNVPILNEIKYENKEIVLTEQDLEDLHNKVVEITIKDGSVIEGIVRETIKDREIILAKDGSWDNREVVHTNNIIDIDASEYPYYSLSYKRRLREQKKPRFEFRFNKEELNDLIGKYILANYDGKVIEGSVTDCRFRDNKANEITIQSTSEEVKTIHDYRLRDLIITGSSYAEHQGFKRVRSFEEELFVILENSYKGGCSEGPDGKVVEPDSLLEQYYEFNLRVLKGDEVDSVNFDYNWIEEIVEQRDSYIKDGEVDKAFYEDVKKARDLNDHYKLRKAFIDEAFNKASEVDWSAYSRVQIDGEIEALEYVYDSGLINR